MNRQGSGSSSSEELSMDDLMRLLQQQVGGAGPLGRGGGAASVASAMANLMARAGSNDGPRGRARQKMQDILKNISNEADDSDQYMGLSELCNELNMATEETLMAIRPDSFVGPIIACLRKEYNVELMLLAARCLTYMVDAIPVAVMVVTNTPGGVEVLLDRLRVVLDIELAEQCLMCIDKIANDAPSAVISNDGISSILGYVDFFSISVQRKAWQTVSNMCKKIRPNNFPSMSQAITQIQHNLRHDDPKIAECAITALCRIIQVVGSDSQKVTEAFGECGTQMLEIIDKRQGDALFVAALQLLSIGIASSPEVSAGLIEIGAVHSLMALLEPAVAHNASASPASQNNPNNAATTPPTVDRMNSPESLNNIGQDSFAVSPSLNAAQPPVTPPRGAVMEGFGSSGKGKSLSSEMLKDVCSALVSLLPKINEGYMAYTSEILRLDHHRGAPPAAPPVALRTADGKAVSSPKGEEKSSRESSGERADNAEEDDDDGEDEDGDEITREDLDALVAQGSLDIMNEPEKHVKCRLGRHSCDGCGERSLTPGNWFRCNACADFDLCLKCVVEQGEDHTATSGDEENPHSFTDMEEVQLAAPEEAIRRRAEAHVSAATCKRTELFAESPYLLQRVVEVLPTMVRLRLDAEHPKVQALSLVFITRAVYHAPADDLRRILVDAPLCEAIATSLASDSELLTQLQCVFVAKQLMTKLPDIYSNLFMREGVTNVLVRIKSTCGQDSRKFTDMPYSESCTTHAGWKAIIGDEANHIISLFPSLTDASRVKIWEGICELLRLGTEDSLKEAFASLNAHISDASTFELLNSSLFQDLRAAFQKASTPVAAVVDFVWSLSQSSLCGTEAVGTVSADGTSNNTHVSNLTRFVRHLQSALSQLEAFKAHSFGPIQSMNTQIRLNVCPHDPDKYAAELKALAATKPAGSKKGTSSHPSSPTAVKSPQMPVDATPATQGKAATVSIEPLASVGGVIDFVKNNLLPTSVRKPRDDQRPSGQPEEEVEDVLGPAKPPAAAASSSTSSSPTSPTRSPQVYIRIGKYALPPSLTMLQVIQRFVKRGEGRESMRTRHRDATEHLPAELRAMLANASSTMLEPITIHYSTVPFAKDVHQPSTQELSGRPTGNPGESVRYLPVGEAVITEGCTNIRNSIFAKFEFSHQFLSPAIQNVLSLLGVLYNTIAFWECVVLWLQVVSRPIKSNVPTTNLIEFVNQKLNNKAMRHSAVLLLAGQHTTTWAVNLAIDCNFLFTAQVRKFLFEVSFFGTARSLVRMQEYMQDSNLAEEGSIGGSQSTRKHRLQRMKKRVWRDKCLECAMEVFNGQPGSGSHIFEFEFYDEEGSGLGPTLEFYTLVGDALRERRHGIWRSADERPEDKYYVAPRGLFPRPLLPDNTKVDEFRRYYRFVGRYLARSLLDKRNPNLRLSRPLVKILRGDIVSFDQLQNVNPDLFNILRQLLQKSCQEGCNQVELSPVTHAESFGLTFVLPGLDDIELLPGGADIAVTSENTLQYINLVAEFILKKGIDTFMTEMRAGFHELVPLYALRILTVDELQAIFDGHCGKVSQEEFEANCAADHGFSLTSPQVKWLFELLSAMEESQQRRFFQFLTGSPYLPVGGLASLKPKMTIVRKTSTDPKVNELEQLPSAMTCQNYLKLPAYESKEKMEKKLIQAMEEGCGVFLFT